MLAVEGISSMSVMKSELNSYVGKYESIWGKLNKTLQHDKPPRAEIKQILIEANNNLAEFRAKIAMAESVIKTIKPKNVTKKKGASEKGDV